VWPAVGTDHDPGRDDWLAGYVERVTELLGDAGRVNAQLAGQWGDRSLHGGEWTVDTMTADAIEAWEHLTPLAGRGVELWLELVQRVIRPGDPP
jgi:hypothetical protein